MLFYHFFIECHGHVLNLRHYSILLSIEDASDRPWSPEKSNIRFINVISKLKPKPISQTAFYYLIVIAPPYINFILFDDFAFFQVEVDENPIRKVDFEEKIQMNF